jgi:diacylglycerol kinase (ATP)
MAKVGVITNPGSLKNKRSIGDLTDLLSGRPDACHAVPASVAEIPQILADFARREVGVIAVAGGDGTVQAVLTALYGGRPFETPPLLAVVARGTTNMTAADVGLRRRGTAGLARLLEAAAGDGLHQACVTRRVLRLDNGPSREPQFGMFFGGAGICRIIEFCRARLHPYRITANAAAAVALVRLLGGWLARGTGGAQRDRVLYGDRMAVTFDDRPTETMENLMILATTLDRLVLGSRPFWSSGAGYLRFTSIAFPPERLLRYAWRLLYGGPDRRLPASYMSRTADRVRLDMDCTFTLDGELFEPAPGEAVVLTAADEATFVRL